MSTIFSSASSFILSSGSFYLCRTAQNFFSNTRKFKIQWLDLNEPPNTYKLDFLDSTDADCVLTNVKMERVSRETFRYVYKMG